MSTFGEIVEPTTRSAWEDWDEIANENGNYKFRWIENVPAPEVIDTFIILEGKYLHELLSSITDHDLHKVDSIKEVSLSLYKVAETKKYICVIKDYNLLQSSDIIEILMPYLSVSTDVIAIQTKPLAEYQTFELSNEDCLIRSINTSKLSKSNVDYHKLEQPNIISGVSAGVISLREHLGLSGQAIICYIEHPEEYQIEKIATLMKKINLVSKNNLKTTFVTNSNLYI